MPKAPHERSIDEVETRGRRRGGAVVKRIVPSALIALCGLTVALTSGASARNINEPMATAGEHVVPTKHLRSAFAARLRHPRPRSRGNAGRSFYGAQCTLGIVNATRPTLTNVTRGGSSAYVGDTLRTTAGTWTVCGTTINYYIYEWLRAGGSIYTSPHTTATTNDHVTVIADLGATMQSRVQACSNLDGCSSTALSSNSISAINRAPAVPTSPSPANGSILNSPVTLSGLFSDADTGQTGHLQFFISGNGGSPWGSTVSSGQASTVPVSLTPGTTYTWYAKATDLGAYAAQISGATATYSFTVNSAPANPTSLAPANGRIENSEAPTLSSTYSDSQSQSGYVNYTVKRASDNVVVASGHGPSVASGSTSSWTVPSGSLVAGTSYNWYAQAVDALGLTSASVGPTSYIDQYRYGLRRQFTYQEQQIDDQESLSVNVANGNLVLSANDLQLPGIAGFDLRLPRYFNSLYASSQSLGNPLLANGWEQVPNIGIFPNGDIRYAGLSGYEVTFVKNGSSYSSPPGIDATLSKPDANYLLTFHQSGEQQKFDSTGALLAYLDKNGNTISFNRAGGQITSITDSFGRSTSFTYNGSNQLTTITDPLNHTYQYGYTSGNLTSFTDPANKVTAYAYNGSNQLTQATDPQGHATKIAYDANKRVSSITTGLDYSGSCPGGTSCPVTSFSYGVVGQSFCATPTTKVTDPNGGATYYCFDGRLRVTKVQDPSLSVSSTDYTSANGGSNCTDGNGNTLDDLPCSTTDELGNTTTYGYDANRPENKLWSQSPLETPTARTSFAYADANHPYYVTSTTDARGKVTSYTYDTAGNKTSTILDGVTTEEFTYNAQGQVASSADGAGKWTSFTYDGSGHLASRTDPLGSKTTYTYDDAGHVLTKVDPLGNVTGGNPSDYTTTYTYDNDGRLKTETDPLANTTTHAYDGAGNKTSVTDGNGHTTTYGYDANNRLVSVTAPDPDGAGPLTAPLTTYSYDAAGNKITQVDPRGYETGPVAAYTTTYGYNADNRLASVTTPKGEETTYEYYEDGNLWKTVDPRGNVVGANPADYETTKTYDDEGRLATESDPLGHTTTYGYDEVGNRTSVADANNHTTSYTYDATGRVLTITAPDNGVTTYTYDGNGNVLTRRDANSHTTSYVYDNAGHLASTTGPDPDGAGPLTAPVSSYSYDANGNRSSMVDPNGNVPGGDPAVHTTSYAYDRDNRLAAINYVDSTPDVSFGYDGIGKRTSMSDGAGTVSYVYDADSRLTSSSRGTDSFSYAYDAAGNVTSRTYPGSTAISYGYDEDNRLATVTNAGATTTYGYDPAGDLTQTTLPATNGYVETRTYDNAGRLTEVKNAKGAFVLSDFAYTLDPVGNPTRVDQGGAVSSTTTYGYDASDRLTSVCYQASCAGGSDPFIRWTYDGVGNRLTETRPSGATTYSYDANDRMLSAGSTSYSYDANGNEIAASSRNFNYDLANRLMSTTNGSSTTTYSYDGDGNRLQASIGSQAADKTNYLWDTNGSLAQLATEQDGNGVFLRRYIYGVRRISMTSQGSNWYYVYDRLGSVVNVTSSAGATDWTYEYEPFGALRAQTQGDPQAPTNSMKFAGEYLDESALYYLRAREEDPVTGRFLRPDPASEGQGQPLVGTYIYANDRPTVLTDPSGEDPSGTCARFHPTRGCLLHQGAALLLRLGPKVIMAWAAGTEVRAIDVPRPFIRGVEKVRRFRIRVAGASAGVAQVGLDYLDGRHLSTTARLGRAGLAAASAAIATQAGISVGGSCTVLSGGSLAPVCTAAGVGTAFGVSVVTGYAASRISRAFGWGGL